jgi:uncharacterized membrane protein YkoI
MHLTLVIAAFASLCFADSEKKIKMENLPLAVQQAVKEQSQGAVIAGLTTESEHGKTIYEAQLTVNGHSKDISFDGAGKVLSIEEEMAIASIPAAAREAIQKAAGTAKLIKVEQVSQGGKISYEATIRRGSKNSEFSVDANGRPIKD